MRSAKHASRYVLLWLWSLAACGDHQTVAAQPSLTASSEPAVSCVPEPAAQPTQRCRESGSGDDSLPRCERWTKVEPVGATCSDGSQYKFFVNYSGSTDNLVVMFEPGGACWDFESCSGGARGAANPHGIPDDHMDIYQYLNLLRRTTDNPAHDWNLVFVPYCTGDVHIGDRVATYEDPSGGPALTFRHTGLANTQSVIEYLRPRFPDVPQLFVTGCSAGGIGALQNYGFVRDGLPGTQCGYLLDDSGPAFHGGGPSQPLQDIARAAWNLQTYLDRISGILGVSADSLIADYGLINTALSDRYPGDRFSLAAYRMDLNYSLYLYERFHPDASPETIHSLFGMELDALINTYETRNNLAYYVPYFRHDNCSHCASIPPLDHDLPTILTKPWLGSDIASAGVDLRAFTARLLDSHMPLMSYVEAPQSNEDFTSQELMECLSP